GEKVRVMATWDTGAAVGAIDKKFYELRERRMGLLSAPTKRLRMADGTVVEVFGHWEGEVEIEGVRETCAFEVFDSGGGWDVLLGKPLQATFGVVHNMKRDVVTLDANGRTTQLEN
ncbi:hypothetical protein K438DRAFT_1451241, partial [Mycena galopus ATCC 62051]